MAIESGIQTVVAIKKQSAQGTIASASGAQVLRRVNAGLNLQKDTYQSAEKVDHQQVVDMRHGVKRVTGPLGGELSPATYKLLMQSLLRQDFAAGATTGAIATVTAAAGPPGTFTRSSGSFLTDGFKVGDVVRWTGWATATDNNNRNYRITALTATVMTVGTAASGASGGVEEVGAEAAGASVTCTVVGKKTHAPATGHTTDWYTVEKWMPTVSLSERFVDCQVDSMRVSLPATGLATVEFTFVGLDMERGASLYFTSPTAATSTGLTAAVNGFIRVNAADQGVITAAEITVRRAIGGEPVVGSNTLPGLFSGPTVVEGQLTAQLESGALRDLFIDETEFDIALMLTASSGIAADCLNFVMPRCKLRGADKNDPDTAIIQTLPFQALYNAAGGAGVSTEQTTISIQDSAA